MKNFYVLNFICLFFFLLVSIHATAQRYGANINNPIQAGTISWGNLFSDTQNNSSVNGFGNDFGQSSDDIFYKFSISTLSEVHISHCASPATGMDTYMYLLDASGNIVASNDDNGPLCSSYFSSILIQLNAGDYYVVSEGYANRQGDITTQISLGGLPPGANMSNAIEAGNISSGGVFVDTKNNSPSNGYGNDFGQPSDDIYYKFTIDNDSEVEISHCNSVYNDTYMSILDVYGNLVYSNDDNGPLCPSLWASLKVSLTAGTYFVVSETYGATSGTITTSISSPQVKTVMEESNFILANLDKTPVNTGILYDKVFPLASFQDHQGLGTDDTTNSDHFHQSYYEVFNSMLNNSGYIAPETLNDYLKNNYTGNEHAVGILFFNYNYLDTNAVRNNQVYVSNGQLYDIPNRSSSPFLQNTLFLASPLMAAEAILETGDHDFSFDPSLIITNAPFDIASISVNFDDGYGDQELYNSNNNQNLRTLGLGNIFKKVAHFVASKFFFIRLVVVLTNGQTYSSISKIFAKNNKVKTIIAGCNGGDVINITGDPFNGAAYGKGSESAEGKAYIFYSNNNCSNHIITKPVIFLDGFDPFNGRDAQKMYDESLNIDVQVNGQPVKLGDKLRADGYDIILFDYKDGSDLIEKNGLAVVKLLQQLYAQYGNSMQSDFVVIGPSMGALVAQYALAYAEAHNIPTHTRLYISFDGPHQGANVAIGMQQTIDYLFQRGVTGAVFSSIRNGMHRGYAARQMLVHNSSTKSESPIADNFRNIFLNNLASVNKYPNPNNDPDPTKTRKVAIINGSNNLSPNQFLQPGGEVLFARVGRAGLLGLLPGKLGDRLNAKVLASPNSGRIKTSDIWLFSPVFNLLFGQPPQVTKYATPANGYSYDASVGSYFTDIADKYDPYIYAAHTLLYLFGGNKTTFRHNIRSTFMPTTSAIDLQVPSFTLAYDFSNENLICTRKTPFDMVYAPSTSQFHVEITDQNAAWFDNEIKGIKGSMAGKSVDWPISGRDQLCTSDTYSIPNLPVGGTVNWSVSPANIVSLTNSNNIATVTPQGSGTVTLTATVTSFCGVNNISKQVVIGGQPTITSINYYQNGPCYGGSQTWYLQATPSSAGATNWHWYVDNFSSGTFYIQSPNSQNTYITVRGGGGVSVTYTDQCGNTSARTGVTIYSNCNTGSRIASYPNPADQEMTVDYQTADSSNQAGTTDQTSTAEQTSTANPGTQSKTLNSFSVELYNDKGKVLKSGKSANGKGVVLNTADIQNGNYFLHVKDGKEVTKKQVIIQH